VCIAAFLLVQFAFVDFFIYIGWEKPMDTLEIPTHKDYLVYVFFATVLIPIFEELIFRLGAFFLCLLFFERVVFQKPTRISPILAIVISALAFAIYHQSFNQLVYQFILGLIFATAFYLTGNFLYPIMLHFINNFFIITYTFIAGTDYIAYTWNWYTILAAIFSALVGSAIIYFLVVKCLKKEQNAK